MQGEQPHALAERYGNPEDPRHPETQKPICASRRRSPNRFGDYVCLGTPYQGSRRCRLHGGATPTGIASPHFKTGEHVRRHAHRVPIRLMNAFDQALSADADQLLELDPEIALIDVRLDELLAQLGTGESSIAWADAVQAFKAMKQAMEAKNVSVAASAMNRLETLLTDADLGYDDKWTQIQSAIQHRRILVETARKVRLDKQETMTAKEAAWLFRTLMSIIKARVDDRDALAAITADINGLIAARMRTGTRTGSA